MNKAERLDAINEVKEDSKVLEFIAITMQERDTALKEIDRLNNIISELEKYIEGKEVYKMLEIKLKELKEKE